MDIENLDVREPIHIVFMGTPEFSVPVLEGLIEHYKVRGIVTQPDKKVGRKQELRKTPVKLVGEKHTILVIQPKKIREEYMDVLALKPDLIITCAYGQILPRELLVYPKYGCINVHASLLPKLRGGAPIHRAIMNGLDRTGVTIMYMSEGMDEGDIISQREIEITNTDTTSTLHDKLSVLGRDLLLDTLPSILDGTASRTPQDASLATYGFNIQPEDEKIDFKKTTRQIYNQVRGLNDFPGAYCIFEGKRLKVWECMESENAFPQLLDGTITNVYDNGFGVKVGNGEVIFTIVQPEGKSKMDAKSYANGMISHGNFVGKVLG